MKVNLFDLSGNGGIDGKRDVHISSNMHSIHNTRLSKNRGHFLSIGAHDFFCNMTGY